MMMDSVSIVEQPAFTRNQPLPKGKLRAGVLYERKVIKDFKELYNTKNFFFVPGFWVQSTVSNDVSFAELDGIFVDIPRRIITIVEIKLTHIAQAGYQLKDKYMPLIKALFGAWVRSIRLLEVCKNYDPWTHFPYKSVLLRSPKGEVAENVIGVYLYE